MAPAHDAALLASASADWHAEHQSLHAAGAPGDARGSQSSAGGETLEAAVYGAAPAHVVAGQALHADGSPGDAGVKALAAGGELVAPDLAAVDLDVDAAFVPDPLAEYAVDDWAPGDASPAAYVPYLVAGYVVDDGALRDASPAAYAPELAAGDVVDDRALGGAPQAAYAPDLAAEDVGVDPESSDGNFE